MRKFLALAALSVGMFSPLSNATVWRLALCESMLTSDLKPFASDQSSLLVSLRDLKLKMAKQAEGANWDGTGFESIRENRSFQQIPPLESAKIRNRIEEIEKALTNSRADQQIWAVEFRGHANAVKAINELTSKYLSLRKEFYQLQSKLKEEHPEIEKRRLHFLHRQYAVLAVLNVAGLATVDHASAPIAITSAALVLLYDSISLACRSYGRTNFNDSPFRRDLALTLLTTLAEGPNKDWLHMQSTNLVVPTEFHKSIYSGEGADREEARMKAYLVNSYFSNFIAYTVDLYNQLQDAVKTAGDLTRQIYVDQISYWDKETNEPVWILVYRAARQRPTPRKPKQVDTKESKEESLEEAWAPNHGRVEESFQGN